MVIQLENLAGLDPECWPALVIHILQLLYDRENRRVIRLRLSLQAITHLADGRLVDGSGAIPRSGAGSRTGMSLFGTEGQRFITRRRGWVDVKVG